MNDQSEKFVMTEAEQDTPLKTEGISVLPHLLVVGSVLLLVFGAIIIPKTISFLDPTKPETELIPPVETAPPETPKIEEALSLRAKAVHVLDLKTGETLYSKNADEPLPLASITKLMTALLAYEIADPATPITISREAALQYGGGVTWGETFSLKELADYALVSSVNTASYGVAAAAGALLGDQDEVAQFIAAMNIKATELNLPSLSFKNPTGLDISETEAGAYGNAKDVSSLVAYMHQVYPEVLAPSTIPELRLYNSAGAYHLGENTNDSLRKIPNLLGSKTGYTDLAGGNLTIIFDAGYNRPIVVTVLGSTLQGRFADIETLVAAVTKTLNK